MFCLRVLCKSQVEPLQLAAQAFSRLSTFLWPAFFNRPDLSFSQQKDILMSEILSGLLLTDEEIMSLLLLCPACVCSAQHAPSVCALRSI